MTKLCWICSVKLVTLDHFNQYVYCPLVSFLDSNYLHVASKWLWITPDVISLTHILVAALGSRLLISDSLTVRRIGVLLFELRTMLDTYDGYVYRARSNQTGLVQVSGSWGYYFDGLCDGAATTFCMVAFLKILTKAMPHKKVTFRLPLSNKRVAKDIEAERLIDDCEFRKFTMRHALMTALSISLLQFLSSVFWNRFIQLSHIHLEVPVNSIVEDFQISVLQSTSFWIIAWTWKLLNPNATLSIYLYTIFFDFGVPFMVFFQYLAFVPLLGLAFISECHTKSIEWKLSYLVNSSQ